MRLGDKLSEGDNGVFAFDKDAHTVQVHNGPLKQDMLAVIATVLILAG